MHVVATAGHVDHGKSTLVRALTGMEPDRWAEERRRGMTIDLGFAWTTLPPGERLAFVDVPGHERFVTTMLAGVGPVPAVMVVVAADEGWMPQSAEHLAAIDALGVRHGLLVVTRADRADPATALAQAEAELARTTLGGVEAVTVSGTTGQGLPDLREALGRLAARLPAPDAAAPVRIWIDRAFTIKGSGTVVTGTLAAGTVRAGGELLLDGRPVRVRALQTLKENTAEATGVARVAVNLRGVERDDVSRGMALTGSEWTITDLIDVRVGGADRLPREPVLHIGSAAVPVRLRPLGDDAARLTLSRPLPLHIGDRLLLRDPGARRIAGADVLDVRPPPLRRRGAAAARARELADGCPRRGATSSGSTAWPAGPTWSPWAWCRAPRGPRSSRWRTGSPTPGTGPPWDGGWPRRSTGTPPPTRSNPACRSRRRVRCWTSPTAAWSPRSPGRRCGSTAAGFTRRPRPACPRRSPKRSAGSAPTWANARSTRRRPTG